MPDLRNCPLMVTLRDSLVSSSARPLNVRKRPDLLAQRQHYQGRSYWIVKDPLGLQYFRFQEEEYALLQMLDGETSMDELKERFEDEFPPQKITLEEMQQFLGMLHRSNLIVASVPGQGTQLRKRRGERRWQEIKQTMANILYIRFKGLDPERLLKAIYPFFAWCYSPIFLCLCLMLALSAAGLVTVEFDKFRAKLPEFHQFFNASNAFWLAAVLGCTKVLHEFGHGLTCTHFGGECHEMGVMFLVLTPCLYCNVSDSWMLPNKWHRMAIGAGGMSVELVLASICTYFWWFSQPGLFNNLCLNVMFVCSITTVAFNANPLLRYDGYYILADFLEIPNLRQKASSIMSRKLAEWFLGMEMQEDPFLPESNQILFAIYAVASAIYRWVVTLSICFFLYRLFESYHFKFVGQALVAGSLWGLLVMPLYKVGKFFYIPGRLEKVKRGRFFASVCGLVAIVGFVIFVPLPNSILTPMEIQARDAAPVYVEVPGKLIEVAVKPGQQVKKGDLLAVLKNPDIAVEMEELLGTAEQYRVRLRTLQMQSAIDRRADSEIAAVRKALEATAEQLEKRKRDLARLKLTAPIDGTVLPPPETPKRDSIEGELQAWSGTPLRPENVGATLDQRTLFCQIGDPQQLEAILVIDQIDRNIIHAGQTVDLKVDELPDEVIRTKIRDVAESEMRETSPRLSNKHGGEVSTKTEEHSGIERPISASYQANAPIDDRNGVMLLGLRGTGRIRTEWIPLGTRFWRFIAHTFNFKI